MKHIGKLAILGAALAVSVSAAHASTLLTGNIIVSDSPVGFSGTGGVFNLSGVTNGVTVGPPPVVEPGITNGLPALGNYYFGDKVFTFSSGAAIPTGGVALWSGADSLILGDTETFYATSFSPEGVGVGGDYSIVANGFFLDTGGLSQPYSMTAGTDNITYDSTGSTSIQESLIVSAAPEPSSLMLLGTGLVGAAGAFLRKRVTV